MLLGRDLTASLIAYLRVSFDRIKDVELRASADAKFDQYRIQWEEQKADRDAEPPDENL